MHWIIGTAGHIDHGKTSLIKALTGIDTDRLQEEKARGISIDLGFAALELSDGTRAGVVDVPGHERFIRNMLAGAHGIDLVLFTVAADDGPMPQTVEHLDIVDMLGVKHAVFVLTKADLVTAERLKAVEDEVRRLAAGTAFAAAPILPFAAPTAAGLPALLAAIERTLSTSTKAVPTGRFRLPVDRAFRSVGHGLVVTGTAKSGTVRPGDQVRCLPSGEPLRVRGVEVHGVSVPSGSWGQRIALNLTGAHPMSITRGDVIVDEATSLTCDRFDAVVEVRPSAPRPLKDYQRVRVHLGTAERIGKVVPLGSTERPDSRTVAPGERAFCQLVLAEPVVAMRGDRFILRDETAQSTLGGGVVLLPAAAKRKRSDPALMKTLEALERGDDRTLFETVVDGSGAFAVTASWLAQRLNDTEEAVRSRAGGTRLHAWSIDSDVYYTTPRLRTVAIARLTQMVAQWHASHPLSPGLDLEEARAAAAPGHGSRLFRAFVDELERDALLVREGSALRLPSHHLVVAGDDEVVVERIAAALAAAPLSPPDLKQLAETLGIARTRLVALLKAMERHGQVVAVTTDLYFAADAIDRLRDELVKDLSGGQTITAASFRDRYGTTRKYAIPLLESFDREGITIRSGDVRRLRQPVRKP